MDKTTCSTLPEPFLSALEDIYTSSALLTDPADCWPYGYDYSRRHHPPQAVVFPTSSKEVAATIKACFNHEIPVLGRGGASGAVGGAVPIKGGLVISFEHMNQILKVDPDNRVMIVEAGVINKTVQDIARQHGFFWSPDPTSSAHCTVGGNLAFNAAGPRAVKYGTTRDNTLGLRAVLGTGELIKTGVYTSKGVVGYDLTRLLIGSEGTLGLITEATLKLLPLPEKKMTMEAFFSDMQSAANAVSKIMAQPITPCALEFIDQGCLNVIREKTTISIPDNARALLMIEVDGSASAIEEMAEAVLLATNVEGVISSTLAKTQEQVQGLWAIRKALPAALRKIAPKKINEDIVVPVSKIPNLITELEQLSEKHQIQIVNFGHAGNGNIHVNLLIDPENPIQASSAERCLSEVFDLVLRLSGTLSGEHGVGIEKQPFIDREIEPINLRLMSEIKQIFDPKGILNPNKLFPL